MKQTMDVFFWHVDLQIPQIEQIILFVGFVRC